MKGKTLAVIGLGHIGASTARDAAALGMTLVGYDPGLSIDSALKLPTGIELADSISSAISNADYISINIPYIKGENGTHGIIGKNILNVMKPNAVLLNFARGELHVPHVSLSAHHRDDLFALVENLPAAGRRVV